jgi:tetratricopeptide (TPR) repeat protein
VTENNDSYQDPAFVDTISWESQKPGNKAFLSYVSEDAERVRELASELRKYGVWPWLDRNELGPGLRWRDEIRAAIQNGACFIACFSHFSEGRERSYMREEINLALDELRLRSPRQTWFIPVRLDECEIPDLRISATLGLRDIQSLDLMPDPGAAIVRIATAIRPSLKVSEELRLQAIAHPDPNGEEALQLLNYAVRAEPRNPRALVNRGSLLISRGEYLRASVDLEQACTLPGQNSIRSELGRALWLASLVDEALAAYSRSLREEGDSLSTLFDCGALLYSLGRMQDAATFLRRAYQLAPDDVNVARAAVRPLLHMRDYNQILSFVDQALTVHDHPDLHEARAFGQIVKYKLFELPGDWANLRRPGDSIEDIQKRGIELFKEGQRAMIRRQPIIEEVAKSIDKSVAGDLDNPARLYRASALYAHIYEADRAGPLIERGLELDPQSPVLHLMMAYACEYAWNKTRMAECQEHFDAAKDPESDPNILEEPFPRFTGDSRFPYPEVRRYALVRYVIGGVVQSVTQF